MPSLFHCGLSCAVGKLGLSVGRRGREEAVSDLTPSLIYKLGGWSSPAQKLPFRGKGKISFCSHLSPLGQPLWDASFQPSLTSKIWKPGLFRQEFYLCGPCCRCVICPVERGGVCDPDLHGKVLDQRPQKMRGRLNSHASEWTEIRSVVQSRLLVTTQGSPSSR